MMISHPEIDPSLPINASGDTVLHLVARGTNEELARLLFQNEKFSQPSVIYSANASGKTPRDLAANPYVRKVPPPPGFRFFVCRGRWSWCAVRVTPGERGGGGGEKIHRPGKGCCCWFFFLVTPCVGVMSLPFPCLTTSATRQTPMGSGLCQGDCPGGTEHG